MGSGNKLLKQDLLEDATIFLAATTINISKYNVVRLFYLHVLVRRSLAVSHIYVFTFLMY